MRCWPNNPEATPVVGRWLVIRLACDLTNDVKDRITKILPSGALSGR
jgi:hypothetical protein